MAVISSEQDNGDIVLFLNNFSVVFSFLFIPAFEITSENLCLPLDFTVKNL